MCVLCLCVCVTRKGRNICEIKCVKGKTLLMTLAFSCDRLMLQSAKLKSTLLVMAGYRKQIGRLFGSGKTGASWKNKYVIRLAGLMFAKRKM